MRNREMPDEKEEGRVMHARSSLCCVFVSTWRVGGLLIVFTENEF